MPSVNNSYAKRIGSIADIDPVNGIYGSLTAQEQQQQHQHHMSNHNMQQPQYYQQMPAVMQQQQQQNHQSQHHNLQQQQQIQQKQTKQNLVSIFLQFRQNLERGILLPKLDRIKRWDTGLFSLVNFLQLKRQIFYCINSK